MADPIIPASRCTGVTSYGDFVQSDHRARAIAPIAGQESKNDRHGHGPIRIVAGEGTWRLKAVA